MQFVAIIIISVLCVTLIANAVTSFFMKETYRKFGYVSQKLLLSGQLSEEQKNIITVLTMTKYHWLFVPVAMFMVPVIAFKRTSKKHSVFTELQKNKQYLEFDKLLTKVALAASPLLSILLMLELVILFIPVIIITRSAKKTYKWLVSTLNKSTTISESIIISAQ